ncbi:MAG: hypothetical protein ACI9AU_001566 [Bacteroidia bacterium]|jgi:hypothetical protein
MLDNLLMRIFLISIVFLTACSPEFDLNGTWEARGYECPNQNIDIETIGIEQDQLNVTATKIKGDNCIQSGEVTFSGSIQNDSIIGFMNARNPNTLEEIKYPMAMKIVNYDSLRLSIEDGTTITFKRINK